MNIQQHVGKISWTAADKLMVIGYGFVNLLQIRSLDSTDFGLYSLLVALQTYIFILSDGSALQGVIQFGMNHVTRPRVNYLTAMLHSAIVVSCSSVVFFMRYPLSEAFNEPKIVSVGLYLPVFCLLTLPRAYCLKLLQRDLQMKQIFWINCSWLMTMTTLTFYFFFLKVAFTFQTMVIIAFVGMGISSLVAIIISRGLLHFDRRELSENETDNITEKITLRTLLGFGLPQLVVSALHNTIRQLDVYIVQFYFGSAQVGIYNAAKTLFRVFETAGDSIGGLLFPLTVKLFNTGRKEEFLSALSKAVSFFFVLSCLAVVFLEIGGTRLLVAILGEKYSNSVDQFNMLVLAAIFLPVAILSSVMIGFPAMKQLIVMILISFVVGVCTYLYAGITNDFSIFPLGTVTYMATLAILEFYYVRTKTGFTYSHLVRAFPDTVSFLLRK